MRCPNCGHDFSDGYLCPKCGIDTYIFRKTSNISIHLYNDAIEMAKATDLSGAVSNLEQSLVFDKNNIPARNLLGLIYCETGRIADALKHWIISNSLQNDNNPAATYIDYLQKNGREMEKYNDAVCMYNKALSYLRHGSEDLAIIQLKKAIDTNPNFIDAYNLLTLCCINESNYRRAQHLIDTVLKKDRQNPTALRLEAHIAENGTAGGSTLITKKKSEKPAESREGSMQPVVSAKRTDGAPPIPRYKRKDGSKKGMVEKRDIITFLIALAASAIIILVLIVPAVNKSKDTQISELQAQLQSYAGETGMTPDEVLAMRAELEALQAENRSLRSEETRQANLELLQTAVAQLSDSDYVGCVTTLDQIDTLGFSDEDISKYNSVRATAYPQAANALYTEGLSQFLSNNFSEAKVSLESALKYTSNEDFIDDAYFYLGRIAQDSGDIETARTYFQRVITEYPDSNQLQNTENALEQLDQ